MSSSKVVLQTPASGGVSFGMPRGGSDGQREVRAALKAIAREEARR